MISKGPKNYTITESDLKYEGRVLNLRIDQVKFPNNMVFVREVVEHAGAVGIVPICQDGKVILVRQYRHPLGEFLLEIPAGLFELDESIEQCALRELREETGAIATKVSKLTEFYTSPGYSNEKLYLFLALIEKQSKPEPEDDEFLEIEKIDLEKAILMVRKGIICDSKTIIGLYLASDYIDQHKDLL